MATPSGAAGMGARIGAARHQGNVRAMQRANADALAQAARNLSQVLAAGQFAIQPSLGDVGIEIVNEVKRSMASTRRDPSRTYRRGRIVHIASAPGEAPAPDTGRLTNSYSWRVVRDAAGWVLEVGTNVEYAPWLEFGTVIMEARPHLRPAVAKTAVRIGAVMAREWTKRQRAAARSLSAGARRLPGIL